jgi:hypothetical protein
MKILLQVLIAAGLVWISSEMLELVMGGRTQLTLWITAVFHLMMAVGIWGAYGSQAGGRGTMSLVAAAMASLGYFVLIYPPIAVSQDATLTIGGYIQGSIYFTIAANLAVFGTIAFGVSVWRTRSYPVWIAIALIVCPAVFTSVVLSDGPDLLANTVNVWQSLALIAIGRDGLRRLPRATALAPG